MKTLLASFFLLIFSLQVLPVKEIGKILFKQMMTEEIHGAEYDVEDDCNVPGINLKTYEDPYATLKYYSENSKWLLINSNHILTADQEQYIQQFTPDILTPPPNCC